MATLTFYGAAREVTGSCYLLESPAVGRILLECGMHQGGDAVDRIGAEAGEVIKVGVASITLRTSTGRTKMPVLHGIIEPQQ